MKIASWYQVTGIVLMLTLKSLNAMAVDVYGQVTGPEGNPLPGVVVSANLGGPSPLVIVTDAEGKYRFIDVGTNFGTVSFVLDGFINIERNIGPQTEIDAQMQLRSEETIVISSSAPVLDTRKVGTSGPAFSDLEFDQLEMATSSERLGCAPHNLLGQLATTINPGLAPPPARSQVTDLDWLIICLTTFGGSDTAAGTVQNNGDLLVTPDRGATIVNNLGPFVDFIATLGLSNMQLSPGEEPCFPWTTDIVGSTQVSRTISLDDSTSPPTPYTATVTNSVIDFESLQEIQVATSSESREFGSVNGGISASLITRRATTSRTGDFSILRNTREDAENFFNEELVERYTETITYDPEPAVSEGDMACTGQTLVIGGGTRTVSRQNDFPNQDFTEFTEDFGPQLMVVDGFPFVEMGGREFLARKELLIPLDGSTATVSWTNQETGMVERLESFTSSITSAIDATEPVESLIDHERTFLLFPYLQPPAK